jgi:hypothetical protein
MWACCLLGVLDTIINDVLGFLGPPTPILTLRAQRGGGLELVANLANSSHRQGNI